MHQPDTICVVGGSGFLGRYVVKLLTEAGYRVKIVSRNPNAVDDLKTTGALGQVAFVKGNLAFPETVTRHIEGSAAVVNLVGILFESGGKQNFSTLHALGAEKLAQAAEREGVPVYIHMSALGVDRSSASTYAHTKMLGEKAVRAAFPNATILRPGVMFGAEDNFFNQFAAMAMISPVLPLIGKGETRFQPVYVGDVARAVLEAIRQPKIASGKTFELTGAETMTLRGVMEYVLKQTGRKACLVNVPFSIAGFMGTLSQVLPRPLLTRDQVKLLKYDNVASGNLPGLGALGIPATPVDNIVPDYLTRFRKGAKKRVASA